MIEMATQEGTIAVGEEPQPAGKEMRTIVREVNGKQVHEEVVNKAIQHLADPPPGESVTALNPIEWNLDGTLKAISYKNAAGTLLFKLNFTWDLNGQVTSIERT